MPACLITSPRLLRSAARSSFAAWCWLIVMTSHQAKASEEQLRRMEETKAGHAKHGQPPRKLLADGVPRLAAVARHRQLNDMREWSPVEGWTHV